MFQYGSASLHLRHEGDRLFTVLCVISEQRRKGHATGLMQELIEHADDHNMILQLEARQYAVSDGLNNQQLEAFYAKFGFVGIPDPPTVINMVRFPSQELQAP